MNASRNEEAISRSPSLENTETLPLSARMTALDIVRGLIMMLMAFSHCREYVGVDYYNNLNWFNSASWNGNSLLDLWHQAFISNVVAGGFFMTMGIGIIFLYQARLKDGWSLERICQYLILRGTLLILLQLTVLQLFEFMAENQIYFYAGVLMALGFCMIFSSLILYSTYLLKRKSPHIPYEYLLPSVSIIVILYIMERTIGSLHHANLAPSHAQIVFLTGGKFNNGITNVINFTPIPWFPATAFGLIIGQILYRNTKDRAFTIIGAIAFSFLTAWFVIRSANLSEWFSVGDYKLINPNEAFSFSSYFCMSKYPPSIAYYLWSLGITLSLLYYFYHKDLESPRLIKLISPIKIFGQCALFFFVVHWFIFYGISRFLPSRADSGIDIFALWLLGLCILYPLCKLYYKFKMNTAKDSIWRMF